MRFHRMFFVVSFSAIIATASGALADEPTAAGTSVLDLLRSNVGLTFDSRFYGPSVTSLSVYRPDLNTGVDNTKTPIRTENKLTLSYKLNPTLSVFATGENFFYPAVTTEFVAKDPAAGAKLSKIVKTENYTMDCSARFYAGLSAPSVANKQWGALRLEQNSRYKIPGSRVDLTFYTYIQNNFISELSPKSKDLGFNLIPAVEYQLTPSLKANVSYKLWASHLANRSLFEVGTDLALLGPGMTWDILSNLSLSPYLDFAVGNKVGWDTTAVGMYLWWKLI